MIIVSAFLEVSEETKQYLLFPGSEGSEVTGGLGDGFLPTAGDLFLTLYRCAEEHVILFVRIHFLLLFFFYFLFFWFFPGSMINGKETPYRREGCFWVSVSRSRVEKERERGE